MLNLCSMPPLSTQFTLFHAKLQVHNVCPHVITCIRTLGIPLLSSAQQPQSGRSGYAMRNGTDNFSMQLHKERGTKQQIKLEAGTLTCHLKVHEVQPHIACGKKGRETFFLILAFYNHAKLSPYEIEIKDTFNLICQNYNFLKNIYIYIYIL